MSLTTSKFGWKDRDTAARDLLQLVYHAPEPISQRALELLQAIRSPAIVPELLEIFRDENRVLSERIHALTVIAHTPGDIYLPESQQYISMPENRYYLSDHFRHRILLFVKNHPSNRNWFFDYIDKLPLNLQYRTLCDIAQTKSNSEGLAIFFFDHLMAVSVQHPELFDLYAVTVLYTEDRRPTTLEWLAERWETLVYLCLVSPFGVVNLLEQWEELKAIVFASCPSLIPEYEAKHDAPRSASIDLNQSAVWREMTSYYEQAEAGNRMASLPLERAMHKSEVLYKATAAHFAGKLVSKDPELLKRLIWQMDRESRAFQWQDYWIMQDAFDPDHYSAYSPMRFELGDVLRNYPEPLIWDVLIDSYFFVARSHHHYFLDWIAYQTDRLSGLDVEYTGATLAVEDRPWFRALVEREKQTE